MNLRAPLGFTLRSGAKSALEGMLTSAPGLAVLKARARGRKVVLGYHNVIPDDEPLTGDPSSHLRLSRFRRQLDLLTTHCEIVSLDEVLEPGGSEARLQVAITFDDAYVGTLRLAVPELATRGLQSTIFVPSALMGQESFWWDALGLSGWEGDREPLRECRGIGESVRSWAKGRGIDPTPQGPSQRPGSASDLAVAAATGAATFGVHTHSHANLAELDRDEIMIELATCREWIRAHALPEAGWVAYPYGLATAEAALAVRALGFCGAFRITGGWVPSRIEDPFHLPRANVPSGTSDRGFLLRVYGVLD